MKMDHYIVLLLLLVTSSLLITCNANDKNNFLDCMVPHKALLFAPDSQNYTERFFHSVQNWRLFNHSTTPKPDFIFVPYTEAEIQSAVLCCKKNNFQIRVKSNGHDYEGLSLLAHVPYIVIDLVNHARVDIDIEKEEAYVETGMTLGELYLRISEKSQVHGFPGGNCPSVGVGGHISGGGWGLLLRKYGLAADNVIDARLIDVNGRILTRETMGEDLFWAIRGSGGASFGIITAWKLKLVRVSRVVTWGKVYTFNETALDLFHRWQSVAPTLPKDLFIAAIIKKDEDGLFGFKTIFRINYLGPMSELFPILYEKFPEMRQFPHKPQMSKTGDCKEFEENSWINVLVKNIEYGDNPMREILMAKQVAPGQQKMKSDYVQTPIPREVVRQLYEKFFNQYCNFKGGEHRSMWMYSQGGKMDEILSDAIPYPHRKGNLYGIEHITQWADRDNKTVAESHLKWMRDVHAFLEPYVSKNPRGAYINYKDLEIGQNNPNGNTSYAEAKVWGEKYFRGNFERLAKVKSQVDPENFFRNEQSIPLFQ